MYIGHDAVIEQGSLYISGSGLYATARVSDLCLTSQGLPSRVKLDPAKRNSLFLDSELLYNKARQNLFSFRFHTTCKKRGSDRTITGEMSRCLTSIERFANSFA